MSPGYIRRVLGPPDILWPVRAALSVAERVAPVVYGMFVAGFRLSDLAHAYLFPPPKPMERPRNRAEMRQRRREHAARQRQLLKQGLWEPWLW